MELNGIFIIFSLIFGACFGSFATMASYRLPRNEDIFFKRSYCPKCGKPIGFFSLIPIFSWIFQGGKCSKCKSKISIRYPIIEIITALLFLLSYFKFGVSYNTIIIDLIIVVCVVMTVSDLENYIFPDSMQISLLVFVLLFIFYNGFDIFCSVISALIYFLLIMLTGFIVGKWKKQDAIGGGDIKFITIVGLILGIDFLPMFLFMSGVIGVIFGLIWKKTTKNEYFPFGPALIMSFLFILFFYY